MKRTSLAAAMVAFSAPVWAAEDVYIPLPPLEVDESQIQVAAVTPFGQTFTPTMPTVGTIWLRVRNMNVGFPYEQDKRLTLNLRAGDDLSGAVLATATANVEAVIGALSGGQGLIAFYFDPVPVTRGLTYSFEVRADTERYGINWQHNNWYGGGSVIALGSAVPGSDLYFGVSAAVPELGTYQLLLLGLGLMAASRLRARPPRPPWGRAPWRW